MVRILKIRSERLDKIDIESFNKIAVVDGQPEQFVDLNLPKIDIVIDHHPIVNEFEAEFSDLRPQVGATATILPALTEDVDGTLYCEYDLQLDVHAHDDPRNGVEAQLGRIWWNLLDTDYENATLQFADDRFWIAEGGFVTVWSDIFPDDTDPPATGAYRFRLRVRLLRFAWRSAVSTASIASRPSRRSSSGWAASR